MKLSQMLLATAAGAAALLGIGVYNNAEARPFYATVNVGVTSNTNVEGFNLGGGPAYGAGIGTTLGPLRIEGGVDRLQAEVFGFEVNATDYHATAIVDLIPTHNGAFFVGGGLDYIQAETAGGPSYSGSGNGYHVVGGYGHRVSENIIMEAGARYINANVSDADVRTMAFTVGMRVGL